MNQEKPPPPKTGTIQLAPTVALRYISEKQELGTAAARLPQLRDGEEERETQREVAVVVQGMFMSHNEPHDGPVDNETLRGT